MKLRKVNDKNWEDRVLKSPLPALVLFTTPLQETLSGRKRDRYRKTHTAVEGLIASLTGKVEVYWCNWFAKGKLHLKIYDMSSTRLPILALIRDGQEVAIIGTCTEEAVPVPFDSARLLQLVESHLSGR